MAPSYIPRMLPALANARTAVPAARIALLLALTALGGCVEAAPDRDDDQNTSGFTRDAAAGDRDAASTDRRAPPNEDDGGTKPPDDEDAGEAPCTSDAECEDGLFCNGLAYCLQGTCVQGVPKQCQPRHECDEALRDCDCRDPDYDADNDPAEVCGGDDCDDGDPFVNSNAAVEICDPDGVDEDCDPTTFGERDGDDDREISDVCRNTDSRTGKVYGGTDCDDADPARSKFVSETCDDIDNDCDEVVDELPGTGVAGGLRTTFYQDGDGDSQGNLDVTTLACVQPEGYASEKGDCADDEPQTFTGGTEICDGKDNDCSTVADDHLSAPAIARTQLECRGEEGWKITACEDGYLDCSPNDVQDGCETPGTTLHNCRACGVSCDFACGKTGCDEVTQLSAGELNTCVVTREGVAACCGANTYGQIGDDSTPSALVPRRVGVISGVRRISTGSAHTCAIAGANSGLYCWGDNGHAQLGSGSVVASTPAPLAVNSPGGVDGSLIGATAVAAGNTHTCAIVAPGNALCWGETADGRVGNDTIAAADQPRAVPVIRASPRVEVKNADAITAGYAHTCILTRDSTVECWGSNSDGQLGRGPAFTASSASMAAPVVGLTEVTAISAGQYHTCALSNGVVYCWGANVFGQLGGVTGAARVEDPTPAAVPGLQNIVQLAAGGNFTCAASQSGALWCWGSNFYGELGNDGPATSTPTQIAIDPVEGISAGAGHVCARLTDQRVQCWGRNAHGQLCDEQITNDPQPLPRTLHWLYGSEP